LLGKWGLQIAKAEFFGVGNIAYFAKFDAALQKIDTRPAASVFV
jgi:hypothetical protein